MITAQVENAAQVEAYLESRYGILVGNIRRGMTAQMVGLQGYVVAQKLSGQVLKNRTGTLRRSIAWDVSQDESKILGIVYADPSVPYGPIHEYGGEIRVPEVSGKLMVFERDGQTIFTRKHKAYTVTMPERSFMRSSLEDRQDEIVRGITAEAVKGLA